MKIYELINDQKSMILAAIDDNNHPVNKSFIGSSLASSWKPVQTETLNKNTYHDFINYAIGKPVISEKTKDIIYPFTAQETEFLPLAHKELNLFVLNVTNILDCVDWERSNYKTFSDGTLMKFNQLILNFNKIPEDTYIFKIKEIASSKVFFSQKFKKLVEQNNLKGLNFSNVFDSDFTEKEELAQREAFEAKLTEIEQNKNEKYPYEEARNQVEEGLAFVSGKWKIQLDKQQRFNIGELLPNLSYQWILPVYIPPILLDLKWHVVERSDI